MIEQTDAFWSASGAALTRCCDMSQASKPSGLSPAERKRLQRKRDKSLGYAEINLRVPRRDLELVRRFVSALPPPEPVTDPDQLDLLAEIDRQIVSDKASPERS